MDVFFYWKNVEADLKEGRLGRFRSTNDKLDTLRAGSPDFIWVFKTPPGQKGKLQLLFRLMWSDEPTVPFAATAEDAYIFYDPAHRFSVWFEGSDEEAAIDQVTDWTRSHLPAAIRSNFHGANGQHELRGHPLQELERIASSFTERPFSSETA
jgi:hypothetical protein